MVTALANPSEMLLPKKIRLRNGIHDLREDWKLFREGILGRESFASGWTPHSNPVEVVHRGPDGRLKGIRRTHNLRTNAGGDWQAQLMGGATTGGTYTGQNRVATATSATSLTDTSSSPAFTTANCVGRILLASDGTNMAFAPINSVTGTVLTIDKWHTIGSSTDATASTPSATAAYSILPGGFPAWYFALSTDAAAPVIQDTSLASEVAGTGSSAGLGRAFASGSGWLHTAVSGTGTTQSNTVYSLSKTFTLTGAGPVSNIQKCGMLTATASGILVFENTFLAATMGTNDTLTPTWTVTA